MTALRVTRDIALTLASACIVLVTALVLYFAASVGHAVQQINTGVPDYPTPTVTGCPFGDTECGG